MNTRQLLEQHVGAGDLDLTIAPEVFDLAPTDVWRAGIEDRIEGMLLGLLIGDSLGNRSEATNPGARRARYGEIRDYLPNTHAGGLCVGTPSDDSQLALWTLESLLEHDRLDPEALATRFCGNPIFGVGSAVNQFVRNFKDDGRPWYRAGARSAGNGALMRIAPVLVPQLRAPTTDLWSDVAIAAVVTHNDRASTGSCVAFVSMLHDLLGRDVPPESLWWLEAFVAALRPIEGEGTLYRSRVPGDDYAGPLWCLLEQRLPPAFDRDLDVLTAGNSWYSGAYLLETVPSALYILMRHGHDPEEAIVRAVNDTRDNDTVGAIVGAAVGALHGKASLPERWIDNLLGRTGEDDDGHAFDLIGQALQRWVRR